MHDLRIVSPLGLTDDDVAAIAAVDGVDEVMPAYMTDMFVDAGEKKNIVTRIHSLPTGQIEEKEPENYLNRLDVVEGAACPFSATNVCWWKETSSTEPDR